MTITGRPIIEKYKRKHPDLKSDLDTWTADIENATWKNTWDITKHYSPSFLSDNRVIFDLKGNRYRLLVKINYDYETVKILKFGTHKEYDRWGL